MDSSSVVKDVLQGRWEQLFRLCLEPLSKRLLEEQASTVVIWCFKQWVACKQQLVTLSSSLTRIKSYWVVLPRTITAMSIGMSSRILDLTLSSRPLLIICRNSQNISVTKPSASYGKWFSLGVARVLIYGALLSLVRVPVQDSVEKLSQVWALGKVFFRFAFANDEDLPLVSVTGIVVVANALHNLFLPLALKKRRQRRAGCSRGYVPSTTLYTQGMSHSEALSSVDDNLLVVAIGFATSNPAS